MPISAQDYDGGRNFPDGWYAVIQTSTGGSRTVHHATYEAALAAEQGQTTTETTQVQQQIDDSQQQAIDLSPAQSFDSQGNWLGPKADFSPTSGGSTVATDPLASIEAQKNANIEAAKQSTLFSQLNQSTPTGSLTFSGTPGVDRTAKVSLTGDQQKIFDLGEQQQINTLNQANNILGNLPSGGVNFGQLPGQVSGLNTGGLQNLSSPNLQTGVNTFNQTSSVGNVPAISRGDFRAVGDIATGVSGGGIQNNLNFGGVAQIPGMNDLTGEAQRVEDALFQSGLDRIEPVFEQERQILLAELANKGIPLDSELGQRQLEQFDQRKADALRDLQADAVRQGTSRFSTLFGAGLGARQQGVGEVLSQGQFANQSQQQGFGQNLAGGQFQNQAVAQQLAQALAQGNFLNQAQGQQFQQGLDRAELTNKAAQGNFAQDLQAAQFGNQAALSQSQNEQAIRSAQLGELLQDIGLQNQARATGIQEQLTDRQLPFQDLAALLGQTQPPAPEFLPSNAVSIAAPDVIGATNTALAQQSADAALRQAQEAQQQQQQQQQLQNLLTAAPILQNSIEGIASGLSSIWG